MKALLLPLVVLVCLALAGCPAYSVHPLHTDEDAVVEPGLEGTWAESGEKGEFTFSQDGAHAYTLVVSDPDSDRTQNYQINLVRLGDQVFMDLVFTHHTVNGDKVEDPLGAISSHVICKLKVEGDDLAYATLEDNPIQQQSPLEGGPMTYVETNSGILITAETAVLRRYIAAHSDDGFSDWEHLTRKRESKQ